VADRPPTPSTATELEQTTRDATHLGTTFQKAQFIEYTDSSFSSRTPAVAARGLLGPLMRAVEGDRVVVTFRNMLPFAASIYVRGWSPLSPAQNQSAPPNGGRVAYEWAVRDHSLPHSPLSSVRSSSMHLFYSHVADRHIDAGLVGAVIVTRSEFARVATATHPPRDVDHELVAALHVVDEDASPLAAANYAQYATNFSTPAADWRNRKWAVNGRMYNTLASLNGTIRVGDRVRVHVAALGDNVVASLAGHLVPLLDRETTAIDFVATRAGPIAISSTAADHVARGMHAVLAIADNAATSPSPPARPHQHVFLQAVEEPQFANACVFRAFADENFTARVDSPASNGVVGPLIRMLEGTVVFVTLDNNCSSSDVVVHFDALASLDDNVAPLASGQRAVLRYAVPLGAAGTYLYRSPSANISSLVGVYVVVDDDIAAENVTADIVVGAIGSTINGLDVAGATAEPLFTVAPRSRVCVHTFAHHIGATAVHAVAIDDAWIEPVRLADGVARSAVLTTPFAGVRRVRVGDVASALYATSSNGDAESAVARDRDAIARSQVRRVFLGRLENGTWAQFADATFAASGATAPVLRLLSDDRLEVRVRAVDAPPPTFDNCLERISGIGSNPSPVDVRTDAGANPAHFVVAASLRAALARSSTACVAASSGIVVLITRRGAERSMTDLAPADVDREHVLVVDDEQSSAAARYEARAFDHVRWYIVSRNATRAVAWIGAAADGDDVVAMAGGVVRTVDMKPQSVGSFPIVGVGAGAVFDVAEKSAASSVRRYDGVDVSIFHRQWGAAGSTLARRSVDADLATTAQLPLASDVAHLLLRSTPSIGTRRRPLVSQLLSAYINFLLADMVEIDVDGMRRNCSECAGGRLLRGVAHGAVRCAQRGGGGGDRGAHAGGAPFDRAARARPLPALSICRRTGSTARRSTARASRRIGACAR
jgi:FtsP/CotA-like multicopper oxidase with cupredoxin domain